MNKFNKLRNILFLELLSLLLTVITLVAIVKNEYLNKRERLLTNIEAIEPAMIDGINRGNLIKLNSLLRVLMDASVDSAAMTVYGENETILHVGRIYPVGNTPEAIVDHMIFGDNGETKGQVNVYVKWSTFALGTIKGMLPMLIVTHAIIAVVILLGQLPYRNQTRRLLAVIQTLSEYGGVFDEKQMIAKLYDNTKRTNIGVFVSGIVKIIENERRLSALERDNATKLAIGDMASKIAHDMRSPLSVLRAVIDPKTSDVHLSGEYKRVFDRSIVKLLNMADGMVDYGKATRTELKIVEMRQYIDEFIRPEIACKTSYDNTNIHMRVENDLIVKIDPEKMERVITNMLDNAVEAVESVSGNIIIEISKCSMKDIILRISDNGRGIHQDDMSNIFKATFTKNKKHGTGLGLAYCKQVVEAHGGTIEVQSEVGKGTTFTIRIPNCVVSAAEARTYRNDPEIKCEGKKFVIIDDDADIRLRWRKIVEESGGKVVGEADSYEKVERGDGLDIAAADVAIVDYNYDGSLKTGIDVISYLKKRGMREIHLCTGFAEDQAIRAAALAAGADSVIKKC